MSDATMDGSVDAPAQQDRNDERLRDCVRALAERAGLTVDAAGLSGASGVRAIVRAARRAGVPVRRRRLSWATLGSALPGVATFSDGSSLLVTGLEDREGASLVLLDSPGGLARSGAVDRHRFEAAWTGELIVLRAPPVREGWRLGRSSLLRLLLAETPLVRDLCVATAGLALLAVVPVLFVQLALARVLPHHAGQTLALIATALGVALAFEVALQALASYCASRLSARMQARLSTLLVDRLLALPLESVETVAPGGIRHRLRAFNATHRACLAIGPRLLLDALIAVIALPLLLVLDWPVALVGLAVMAGAAVASLRELHQLRRAAVVRAEAEDRREAFLLATLGAAREVKTLSLGAERLSTWDALADETVAAQARRDGRLARFAALAVPADRIAVLGALGVGIVLPALSGGSALMPALLAAVLLVQRLAAPLTRLPAVLATLAEASVARRSLADLINTPREPGGVALELTGAVAFEHVGVRYPGAPDAALSDVSCAIEPGTLVGVFGPSGAGKSTLAKLLARSVAIESGAVRLDGRDTRALDPSAIRRQVVVVGGTSTLFAGTVRETITARKADATFEEMTAAARLAGADEFVDRLPRGYETVLTAGAPSLSAGQRQRLALARALLARPAILVLDEALSALDLEMEDAVVARLRGARLGLTTILISHRLSSLTGADAVLVLDRGRLVDHGAPADLAERCDLVRQAAMREGAPDAESPERFDHLLALG